MHQNRLTQDTPLLVPKLGYDDACFIVLLSSPIVILNAQVKNAAVKNPPNP